MSGICTIETMWVLVHKERVGKFFLENWVTVSKLQLASRVHR